MKQTAWGYHLMVDTSGCNIDKINDRENIYNFVKKLVVDIDMTAHGEPIIEYLLPGDPKEGFSLLQLITTSNIAAHFMKLDGTAYFDVFSCKPFDHHVALAVIEEFFQPENARVQYVIRQAP